MLTFKGNSVRHFSVPLIDVSAAELPTPKIDFYASVKVKGDLLQGGLKDAALISSHILMGVTSNQFFLRANSSKGELNHETDRKDLLDWQAKKECSSMFPLDYLQDMLKVADSNTIVSLQLKSNAPVQLSYAVGEAQLSYFLAPRIETA
jgi:proliferating cell nuclear antigen